ncbi:MAG: tetratricopeptide repeat protein [Deltaproteobacteria bacterium]|nr:tetratricopeptide repeat protein [Deltaproteobacteria bacterium]
MARKPRKKPRPHGIGFWIFLILLLGSLAAGWKLWPCLLNESPQFHSLLLQKNGTPLKLINGEGIQLKPEDKIKILEISTNICFNRGVRVVAKDFDVAALLYEETSLAALIIDRDIFNRYEFQLMIKHYNEDLGHIHVVIEPTVEDWLDKADRSIGEERKIAVLERARNFAPQDHRIRDRLIQGYITLKNWRQAALLLEEKSKEDSSPEVLNELLDVYEAMSKSREIISTLRRLAESTPNDPAMRYRLASYLEKTGRFSEAIHEYETLLKIVGKTDKLSIHKTLGFLYAKENQPEKAMNHYLNALEMDQKDVNLYYNISYLYEKIGQKDKADLYLAKAVALKAGDVDSRIKLAESLIEKGRFEEAEEYLEQAVQKEPRSLKAWLLMLHIAEKKGNKDLIKRCYQEILTLDPKNTTVQYNLGVLEYEAGQWEKALNYFKAFLASNPEDVEAHVFLFDIHLKQDNKDQAYQEARILVDLKPQEVDFYRFLYEYLNKKGTFEELVSILEKGVQSIPENIELKEYLVDAYLKTDRVDMAITQINEIIMSRPDDVSLLLQAAKLSERMGHKNDALGYYKKIIEISPGHEEAEAAYLRLRLEVLPLERRNP